MSMNELAFVMIADQVLGGMSLLKQGRHRSINQLTFTLNLKTARAKMVKMSGCLLYRPLPRQRVTYIPGPAKLKKRPKLFWGALIKYCYHNHYPYSYSYSYYLEGVIWEDSIPSRAEDSSPYISSR
jgi:hypothetical protein